MVDLFAAISDELRALNDLALSVQSVLGAALAQRSGDAAVHRAAQSLDLITQRIDGLGLFLATLVTDVPGGWRLDCRGAAERVTLADLAGRLMGAQGDAAVREDGAVEYF